MRKSFIAVIFIFLAVNILAEDIVIGRSLGKKQVSIFAPQDFVVLDSKSGKLYSFHGGKTYTLKFSGDGIQLGGRSFGHYLSFKHLSKGLKVNGVCYYGSVDIKRTSKWELMLLERMDIEEYLPGVLAAEVGNGWPVEALKAQAVISRTYALKNLGKHSKEGYDLCAGVHCQVYKPGNSCGEMIRKAVAATKGKVITAKGRLANTYFHACCGGATADVDDVWGSDGSTYYLKKVNCGYCCGSPHYRWKKLIFSGKINSALKKLGYGTGSGELRSVSISGRDSSGRAEEFVFRFDGKKISVKSSKFRAAVGPDLLKSTKVNRICKRDGGFEFSGKGWGHGVGLCQWGAKKMAEKGYSYKRIIRLYCPGTRIAAKWE